MKSVRSGKLAGAELAADYFLRGNAWAERKEYGRAIADYDAALAIAPGSAETLNNRGSSWQASGNDERALADFTRAIEINPSYILAIRNRAAVWRALAQPERAKRDEAVAFDLAYRRAGAELLAKDRKQVQDAISEASAALERNPRDIDAYLRRGLAWRKWGMSEKARADFTAILAIAPNHVPALVSRGNALLAWRKYDDAIIDYDAALTHDAANVDAHVGRGQVYLLKREPKQAIADLDEALRTNPTHKLALMHRGNAWLAVGEPARAVADFSVGVKTYPDWTLARLLRGFSYFVAGDFAFAEADFEELNLHDRSSDVRPALWLYLARARQGADATAALVQDRNRNTGYGLSGLVGALYAGLGPADKVQSYIERPNTMNWEPCEGHIYLGQWHLLQHQVDAARASFQQAIQSCVDQSVEYAAIAAAELDRMKR